MPFNYKEFEDFTKKIEKLSRTIEQEIKTFFYEMALKAMSRTKKRTPVDLGDLRKQWELGSIKKTGNSLTVILFNPLEYASYVEYGHRVTKHFVPGEWEGKRFIYNPNSKTGAMMGVKTNWIEGKFMATISLKEISDLLPAEWDKCFRKLIGDVK